MKTLIAIIKNIPDEINTDHLDVYVRSKLYRDDFINRIEIDVKDMPEKLDYEAYNDDEIEASYADGFNDCIDELIGDTKWKQY